MESDEGIDIEEIDIESDENTKGITENIVQETADNIAKFTTDKDRIERILKSDDLKFDRGYAKRPGNSTVLWKEDLVLFIKRFENRGYKARLRSPGGRWVN